MTRFITLILLAATLGGCVVLPYDYGYRDDGYRHRHYSDRYYDHGPRHWR